MVYNPLKYYNKGSQDYCDYETCINKAKVEITLSEGEIILSCSEHINKLIMRDASTANPVHSIDTIEDAEVENV